jgi:hypothetical protein
MFRTVVLRKIRHMRFNRQRGLTPSHFVEYRPDVQGDSTRQPELNKSLLGIKDWKCKLGSNPREFKWYANLKKIFGADRPKNSILRLTTHDQIKNVRIVPSDLALGKSYREAFTELSKLLGVAR